MQKHFWVTTYKEKSNCTQWRIPKIQTYYGGKESNGYNASLHPSGSAAQLSGSSAARLSQLSQHLHCPALLIAPRFSSSPQSRLSSS
ncbi:hypothetical protein L1887_29707 [Cichorium endivia]|nr:hypothetical protein L1887_29707 [Cichorium endivia]